MNLFGVPLRCFVEKYMFKDIVVCCSGSVLFKLWFLRFGTDLLLARFLSLLARKYSKHILVLVTSAVI